MLEATWKLPKRPAPLRSEERCDWFGTSERTILAVDDEPDSLELLRAVFAGGGFHTLHATSGAEAIAVIEEGHPDLLIVDYMMAGMNGLELCEYLRERTDTRRIPIIMYSAYALKHADCWLYERSFMKPGEPDELLAAARELVQRPL